MMTPYFQIHARLRATFDSGKTLPLAYRRQQLLQLARLGKLTNLPILAMLHSYYTR